MSGPWYESQGPCASQVRQDVYKYIINNFYNEDELTPQRNKIIRKVILQIIPDTRNDFGSYRGYATFNVPKDLSFESIKEIEIQDKAISILNDKFLPYILLLELYSLLVRLMFISRFAEYTYLYCLLFI